jgi:inositol phosphorylceramide mannosyltransferase catalytic subunit
VRPAICTLTRDDPEQVRAMLAPWRDVAAEVVIACDDRVDPVWRAAYEGLADRVLPVRFEYLERHLAQLHDACTAEWALRVDTDEIPSAALVAAVAALESPAQVDAYAIPRRWLAPDTSGWLDEAPWHPDTQLRLVRRTPALRFSGELHSSAEPGAGVPVLDAALYHLDCALVAREQRLRKTTVYEILRVGQLTDGGLPMYAYYDPERFATRAPVPVPAADRATLDAALRAAGHDGLPPVADAAREPRPAAATPDEAAGEARVELLERDLRVFAQHPRRLLVRVTNTGAETIRAAAPVNLGTRVRWADGEAQEGPRTPLPCDLAPGAVVDVVAQLAPLGRAGAATLELDLVHEGVRWLGAVAAVEVVAGPGYEPPVRREPAPAPRRGGLLRRRGTPAAPIPRVVHRIWLGGNPLPEDHARYGETWRAHHPEWEHRLWTDEDVPDVPALARARNVAERADILRYEILRRHGGVYVDTDVECLQPIDPLLAGVSMFAAYEVPGRACNAVMGGVADHPALRRLCAWVGDTAGRGHYPEATATVFLTRVLEPFDDVTLFGPERFYPYLWDELPTADVAPETYAIHHWAKSWVPPQRV